MTAAAPLVPVGGGFISLQNPVSSHFPAFIAGNATEWEQMAVEALAAKAPDAFQEFAERSQFLLPDAISLLFRKTVCANGVSLVVEPGQADGQHIVVCGAGPSLNRTAERWLPEADQIWACNSALPLLISRGFKPTHGFAIDQTTHMVEEWFSAPDVEYLMATTVHPHLTQFLRQKQRRIRFFHNYVGIKERPVAYDGHMLSYEDWLYACLFPATVRAGAGLNAVTRAVDVAFFMGAAKVTVLGADCCLRESKPFSGIAGSPEHTKWLTESVVMHADGGNALRSEATAVTVQGVIDSGTPDRRVRKGHGRKWLTKPDMMISAVFLEQMRRHYKGKLRLMGDTLPNALRGKTDQYLKELPSLLDLGGNAIAYDPGDAEPIAVAADHRLTGTVQAVD